MRIQKKAALCAVIIFIFTVFSTVGTSAAEIKEVIPGGMPFGVRFGIGKLSVGGFCGVMTDNGEKFPARDAGIMENDLIVMVNGRSPQSPEGITEAVKECRGEDMIFTVERDGKAKSIRVKPEKSADTGEYRIGLMIRDGSAGIGTVTFVVPVTGAFGGLGHGICDTVTGELCDIPRGSVSHVRITEVARGSAGEPGEIRGIFSPDKCGNVIKNCESGVFGVLDLDDIPGGETVSVGDGFSEGKAEIRCTLGDGGICEYEVKLFEKPDGDGTFLIEVTDEKLISLTGGIVQGMSGSPVFQDGKLIGAVTHVLVGDPAKGYGITVKKMIEAMPEELK